jgi:glucose-6-phosphate isomerase
LLKLNTPGLDLRFDEKRFALLVDGKQVKPNLRTLGDLKPVLADAEFARKITPVQAKRIQYYMFRGACAPAHKKVFAKARVSFDVTVLPELNLGKELNKTLGHYHERAASGVAYPEVYEVLRGEALYILQKQGGKKKLIEDVVWCRASPGDQVVIPPGFGHVTVNAGRSTLVMANLIAIQESDYSEFVRHHGAALYAFANGEIKTNPRYFKRAVAPKPREWKARRVWPRGLYASFVADPQAFDFLTRPERVLFA